MKKHKYAVLTQFLTAYADVDCKLTFSEIETILGFPLPNVSAKYASVFWNNGNQNYALIWLNSGRIVTQYNTQQGYAIFTRNEEDSTHFLEKCNAVHKREDKYAACASHPVTSNFLCGELIAQGEKYFEDMRKDKHARYLSWEHCYAFFQKNRHAPSDETLDLLCLHLAWYLASWGMLRGGAFLLQKDYLVHMPVVRLLTSAQYEGLYYISAEGMKSSAVIDEVFMLGKEITALYALETQVAYNSKNNIASDTLITKILLGTIGCTPAYDRYFKRGLSSSGIAQQRFSSSSMLQLGNYYLQHFDDFEVFRKKISIGRIEYTPMKVMDMCLWQLGYEQDKNAPDID